MRAHGCFTTTSFLCVGVKVREFFARHEDCFGWVEPKAGTVCFPRLRRTFTTTPSEAKGAPLDAPLDAALGSLTVADVAAYCAHLVEAHGILLLPATVYDDCELPCFRLGFGRRNMPQVLLLWEATLP